MTARRPIRSRPNRSRGRHLAGPALAVFALFCFAAAALGEPPPVAGPGTHGPMEILFSRDGQRAYVAEFDSGDVGVVDVASGVVLGRIPSGGQEPTALAMLPDDRTLLVTNSHSGTLGFIDLVSARLVGALPLRGTPYDVAVTPDGGRAFVALSQLDQVAVIDLERRKEQTRIPVGRRPRVLAITQNGRRLACANLSSGDVSVIDTDFMTELRRLRCRGVNLRGLALVRAADLGLPSDATLALVSCQVPNSSGQATRVENGQIWSNFVEALPLDGVVDSAGAPGGSGFPVRLVRRFANTEVIGEAWLDPGIPVPQPRRPVVSGDRLLAQPADTQPHGVPHVIRRGEVHAAADPAQIVAIPNMDAAFVASAGIHAVSRIPLAQTISGGEAWPGLGGGRLGGSIWRSGFGGLESGAFPGGMGNNSGAFPTMQQQFGGGPGGQGLGGGLQVQGGGFGGPGFSDQLQGGWAGGGFGGDWGGFQARLPVLRQKVGLNPRCLALTPDRQRLWVANHLGSSISVLTVGTMQVERTIDLGRPEQPDPTFAGRVLFNDGFAAREQWFSCNSCHPDGMNDGRSWRFAHVSDGYAEMRNSRFLRGGVHQTAPFRWSGHEATLEEFAQDEVVGLLKGRPRSEPELRSLAAYLASLRLPLNPHRNSNGSLTASAVAGRELFFGSAGCVNCHQGSMMGGTGKKAWIGTTPAEQQLDVPHLVGAHDSAPYLHDGRAATLEEIFRRHNPVGKHGAARSLTEAELRSVLDFVRQL